jgi:acetyl esterase/lipase
MVAMRTRVKVLGLFARAMGAMIAAVTAGAVRRLLRGPLVATWTWGAELRVVAIRAVIRASQGGDLRPYARELEARFDPPIPRHLRGVLAVEPAQFGGRSGEWIIRRGAEGELTDLATILYLHGGAYIAGSPSSHRHFTSRLTWTAHARTYVPSYRLAPEHPFPAAVDDAEAVYRELLERGTEPRRLVLAGDSAGGGLALALLLRIRAAGLPEPAGAVLFSPYTDLEHSGPSILANAPTDYIPIDGEIGPNVDYLGDADPRDPFASPLHADLAGLPSLLVFAGGREMVLDDSVRLVDKARAAGVDVELHVEPDMFHVWPAVIPNAPASLRALAHVAEWVATRVTAPSGPVESEPVGSAGSTGS